MVDRIEKVVEYTAIAFLIIAGILGILVSMADLFGADFERGPWNWVKGPIPIILLILSILTIAIGLERYTHFSRITRQNTALSHGIEELHKTLIKSSSVIPLIGRQEVYEEAIRLINSCTGSEIIRATSLGVSSEDDPTEDISPFEDYLHALASKIGHEKQNNFDMFYKVVMGFQLDANGEPPPSKKKAILRRRDFFRQNNALDRIMIKYLESSWSLDLILIGNEHVIIGFPTVAGDTELRLGMKVSDKVLVENIVRWYEEHLWNDSNELKMQINKGEGK